jgi:hypothetical protein
MKWQDEVTFIYYTDATEKVLRIIFRPPSHRFRCAVTATKAELLVFS